MMLFLSPKEEIDFPLLFLDLGLVLVDEESLLFLEGRFSLRLELFLPSEEHFHLGVKLLFLLLHLGPELALALLQLLDGAPMFFPEKVALIVFVGHVGGGLPLLK